MSVGWRILLPCWIAACTATQLAPVAMPPASDSEAAGDLDGDIIRDEDDRCPIEPETVNNFRDDDGCPDRAHPKGWRHDPSEAQLRLAACDRRNTYRVKVHFADARSELDARARRILNAVVVYARAHTGTLDIGGHVAFGEPPGLDTARAEVVRAFLFSNGTPAGRLAPNATGTEYTLCGREDPACRGLDRYAAIELVLPDLTDEECPWVSAPQ